MKLATTDFPHAEIAEASLVELAAMLRRRHITSVDLVNAYCSRISSIDTGGPQLRSVLEINADAWDIAEGLDHELAHGNVRSALHGVPILVKDNIDTGDQMQTTAGSLALVGAPPGCDAPLIGYLRDAGAVVLGKTNLSEWANFRSSRSSSGWSGRGGQTRNPYVLDRSPGGSSSGSAVAAAIGLAAASVGTETDGSIVGPASVCSVVGMKPTVGLIPQAGMIPIARSRDSAGPMARTVMDVAILLDAMTGKRSEYVTYCKAGGMRGARIGVLRVPWSGRNRHVDRIFEHALDAMRGAGADLIDPVEIETVEDIRISEASNAALLYEFKHGLNRYLATRRGLRVKSLRDVINFNKQYAEQEMQYFGQEILEMADTVGTIHDPEYGQAKAACHRLARVRGIDMTLRKHALDALVAPGGSPPPAIDLLNPSSSWGFGVSRITGMAGYPIISVPAGFVLDRLPIGVSFLSSRNSEPVLLKLAYCFEQMTQARRWPRCYPTLEVP